MTKDEVLALPLSEEQKEQVEERFFDTWDKLGIPSPFENMRNSDEVINYINEGIKRYKKNQEKKAKKAPKKNARDIQHLAVELCKGKKKKLTFDELYKFIETAVTEKRKKEIANKKAALAEQLAALEAEEESLN